MITGDRDLLSLEMHPGLNPSESQIATNEKGFTAESDPSHSSSSVNVACALPPDIPAPARVRHHRVREHRELQTLLGLEPRAAELFVQKLNGQNDLRLGVDFIFHRFLLEVGVPDQRGAAVSRPGDVVEASLSAATLLIAAVFLLAFQLGRLITRDDEQREVEVAQGPRVGWRRPVDKHSVFPQGTI